MIKKSYSAFTLVEMLVVMGILVILGALSFTTYQDMQGTIRLNEYTNTLEENIRRAQRDAMLLKRETGEGWIYGIGITFVPKGGLAVLGDSDTGVYRVFKWCANVADYGEPETISAVPGYKESELLLPELPRLSRELESGQCPTYGSHPGSIKSLPGYDVGLTPPKGSLIEFKRVPEAEGQENSSPAETILFESVTGKAFFYDRDGKIINYSVERKDGKNVIIPASNPVSLAIEIERPGSTKVGKRVIIQHSSGKITVEALD